ncbi:hypothetical protein BCR35DRAFT_305836 [Leucosporidium creatinivorum]|uniref:VWFA domain-containing protein n=1 Tax=Leucosporidium creatinivorum TaxID=106004 RepID=A0A1Y2EXB7_9BASI|nr:hypothetical protein BCR35DRAFT_305836 [Leucosporidium creatinivorum]
MDDDMMDSLNSVQYQPLQQYEPPQGGERKLDLVFILDCTGSMGSYIASATTNIELIVENILSSGKLPSAESLRIGLIAYRDYPPQDNSYITKSFEFTSDVSRIKEDLKTLYASGGGDGPEGVTAAMKAALELSWRPDASRMAVLVADAPAHGIGEYGDGFPNGGPDGEDPLLLARTMAAQGISLFVVACEPACSGYQFATDFFRALTVITSAVLVPLTTASLLSHVIVGSALEQMDMDRLIKEVGFAVSERVHGGVGSVDDVARELQEKLMLRGEATKQLSFESIHRETDETRHNVDTFVNAESLAAAKPNLKKVIGSRFTEKYLQTRYTSAYASRTGSTPSSSLYPSIPARPGSTPSPSGTPSSPPRKVVSEFKPFAASSGLSMANTALGANVEEDMTDESKGIELKFSSISLEQAKRITIAAAWRTAPPRA